MRLLTVILIATLLSGAWGVNPANECAAQAGGIPDDVNGKVLPATTSCDWYYLFKLASLFPQNLYGAGGVPQNDPTQWAAIGFDRRIKSIVTVGGVRKTTRMPEDFYKPRHNHIDPLFREPNSPYNIGFTKDNLFCARSFLKWYSEESDETRPGDNGNYKTRANAPTEDLYRHTERTLRDLLWDKTTIPFAGPLEAVHMYTFSTPCFFGCRRDVFTGPNSIMEALSSAAGQDRPSTTRQFWLGFHTQYKANDDLQLWQGFRDYMAWPVTTANRPDPTNKWNLVPLYGTFQELLVGLLMQSEFCKFCELDATKAPNYTPDFTWTIDDYTTSPAQLNRANSIAYIVETIMYEIERVTVSYLAQRKIAEKCGEAEFRDLKKGVTPFH